MADMGYNAQVTIELNKYRAMAMSVLLDKKLLWLWDGGLNNEK